MKPLRQKDVAQIMEVHESTVSRAVKGKYLQCGRGVYALSDFMPKGMEEVSSDSVKQMLKKIIQNEDKKKPLSDQKLVKKLEEEGSNIGNLLYVLTAFAGGLLITSNGLIPNLSIQNLVTFGTIAAPLSISAVASYLGMCKQFTANVSQVSQQMNAVAMAVAGAGRIFDLLDQKPESDEGTVTLTRCREENGTIVPCAERTGKWAWQHQKDDGTMEYRLLQGDVRFFDVDFGYVPDKTVLHNVSLYAKPGQKLAFVGATGAGKTTITNLINRFYDIADGKIRYEIDNRRREVTIDDVDTSSRNLLSNPAHAFDFIGTQYAPSLVSDAEGRAVVRLTPTSADASPAGEILVTVDTAAMRPESLRYDYDGEQVGIAVLGVAPLDTPLKAFSKGDYKGYEFIDFR